MMTRISVLAAVLYGLTGLPGSPAALATPTAGNAERASTPASVMLLEAGSSPREKLRYAYTAGEERAYVFRNQLTIEHRMEDTPMMPEQSMPEMIINVKFHIDEVDDEGKATCRLVFEEVNIDEDEQSDPVARRQVLRVLGLMRDHIIHMVICDRGLVHSIESEGLQAGDFGSIQAMEDMQQSLTQLVLPLPEQAVGPGARWKVDAEFDHGEFAMSGTSTYELKRTADNEFTVKMRIERTADQQTVTDPTTGQSFELKHMKSELDGAANMALHACLPMEADIRGTTRTTFEMDMQRGQGPQKMEQTLTTRASIHETTDDDADEAKENDDE